MELFSSEPRPLQQQGPVHQGDGLAASLDSLLHHLPCIGISVLCFDMDGAAASSLEEVWTWGFGEDVQLFAKSTTAIQICARSDVVIPLIWKP